MDIDGYEWSFRYGILIEWFERRFRMFRKMMGYVYGWKLKTWTTAILVPVNINHPMIGVPNFNPSYESLVFSDLLKLSIGNLPIVTHSHPQKR